MPRLSDATWELAKQKYVTNPGVTYRSLAKELNIASRTVDAHAKKGNWLEERKAYFGKTSALAEEKLAEMSDSSAQEEANRVSKELRLLDNYQAGLSGIILECLFRLGIVKEPRNEQDAESIEKAPGLWDSMSAKDLSRVLQKSVEGQIDLMKQKSLIGGGPTERYEMVSRQTTEILIIERSPEEQREFERVVRRIRETAEEAGLKLPEG